MPSTEEQDHHNRRSDNNMRIFGDKEESELKTAIFRMETADEFLLRFRHVEWKPVGFHEKSDNENKDGNRMPDPDANSFVRFDYMKKAETEFYASRQPQEDQQK